MWPRRPGFAATIRSAAHPAVAADDAAPKPHPRKETPHPGQAMGSRHACRMRLRCWLGSGTVTGYGVASRWIGRRPGRPAVRTGPDRERNRGLVLRRARQDHGRPGRACRADRGRADAGDAVVRGRELGRAHSLGDSRARDRYRVGEDRRHDPAAGEGVREWDRQAPGGLAHAAEGVRGRSRHPAGCAPLASNRRPPGSSAAIHVRADVIAALEGRPWCARRHPPSLVRAFAGLPRVRSRRSCEHLPRCPRPDGVNPAAGGERFTCATSASQRRPARAG